MDVSPEWISLQILMIWLGKIIYKFGFWRKNYMPTSFTLSDITLNLTVGSNWDFTSNILTRHYTLGYTCSSIQVQKGLMIVLEYE